MDLTLICPTLDTLHTPHHVHWAASHMKYLGIYLPRDLDQLYVLNCPPLLQEIHTDLEKWHMGTISWLGRCKVECVTKIIIQAPSRTYRHHGSVLSVSVGIISRFVWAHKPARIKHKVLCLPRVAGGLALPDIHLYYVASHLSCIIDWCRHTDSKQWVQMEQAYTDVSLFVCIAMVSDAVAASREKTSNNYPYIDIWHQSLSNVCKKIGKTQ